MRKELLWLLLSQIEKGRLITNDHQGPIQIHLDNSPEQLVTSGIVLTMGTRANRMRRGMTLLEILIVFVIIAILSAIILQGVRVWRGHAYATVCQQNLRQIVQAGMAHLADKGYWPPNNVKGTSDDGSTRPANIFSSHLLPYLGLERYPTKSSPDAYNSPVVCPADPSLYTGPGYGLSYGQNSNLVNEKTKDDQIARMALYMEFTSHYVANIFTLKSNQPNLLERHAGKMFGAFVDGSVRRAEVMEVTTSGTPQAKSFWDGQ